MSLVLDKMTPSNNNNDNNNNKLEKKIYEENK